MSLDEQLEHLLFQLGVVLEEPSDRPQGAEQSGGDARARFAFGLRPTGESCEAGSSTSLPPEPVTDEELAASIFDVAEVSLFQTSREHYGVFYRLDLIGGAPQLRIFLPDDEGALKMCCYLVRPAAGTPLNAWFASTRAHRGSAAYDDARDAAQQHLLFAAGELLKRLFWSGDLEAPSFPHEIEVVRLA